MRKKSLFRGSLPRRNFRKLYFLITFMVFIVWEVEDIYTLFNLPLFYYDLIPNFKCFLSSKANRDPSNPNSISVDFAKMFTCLRSTLESDESSTLLLYLLLHRNADFRAYIFASSDIDLVNLERLDPNQ